MKTRHLILALGIALLAAACGNDEDFVAPSFLHIDAIQLVQPANNVISTDPGFYTAEIVSCYVEAYFPETNKMEMLGHFPLPFTAPVLHDGPVEYFVVSPCIKISGVSGMQNYYPFYQRDTLRNVTLHSGDTLRFDTLQVSYRVKRNGVLLFEPFEPTEASLTLDSVTWHRHAADEACTGEGYASVHVPDSLSRVPFAINRDFYVPDPLNIIYLELDTRSDIPFEVYMVSRTTQGGNFDTRRVMVVNPSSTWKHLYITLGRTWTWFNYNPDFRISFAALNVDGQEGDIRIDNIKVLTTNDPL